MSDKLAGPIGLFKQCVSSNRLFASRILTIHRFVSRTARETAEGNFRRNRLGNLLTHVIYLILDAVQIFGGRGLTVTGMGKLIESVSVSFSRFVLQADLIMIFSTTGPLALMLVSSFA
jgi:hypothetical protein